MAEVADTVVLRRAGEQAVAAGHAFLDHEALERACAADGLGHERVFAALRALDTARLVDVRFVAPSRVTLLRLTDRGVRVALDGTGHDLVDVRRRLVRALTDGEVDWRAGATVDLRAALGVPALVSEVALEDLRKEGRVVFSRAIGGGVRIHRLSDGP
ncbi:MAG TPA: hypothetical protein VFJ85_14900 [Acidimicrobiales bacterium]|nr:hypothetical protein [Acidimicrobiales bacterium]